MAMNRLIRTTSDQISPSIFSSLDIIIHQRPICKASYLLVFDLCPSEVSSSNIVATIKQEPQQLRLFAIKMSTTTPPDATYGFIGLGNMGFGMAKNVREKMPSSSTMIVCELVTSQRDEFCSTIEGKIETAETPKEIAEKCVCTYCGSN